MNNTSDPMIRAEIRRRLSAAHPRKDAVIDDELRVDGGGARIDVAVDNRRRRKARTKEAFKLFSNSAWS